MTSLTRRITRLEHEAANTVPRWELQAFLARYAAVALTHMPPETGERYLHELLHDTHPRAALGFLDQIRAALLELQLDQP